MGFAASVKSCFSKYIDFSGRASRSEYWWFIAFSALVGFVTGILDFALFPRSQIGALNVAGSLFLFLPGLAVGVRRLHDRNLSGWWLLLPLTIVGGILLLVWFCLKGDPDTNRFGNPQGLGDAIT